MSDDLDSRLELDASFAAGFDAGLKYAIGDNDPKDQASAAARETVLRIIGSWLDQRIRQNKGRKLRSTFTLIEVRGFIARLADEDPYRRRHG